MPLMGDARDYALKDLRALEQDGHISSELADRGCELVGLIFRAGTVYASIGPLDDGDLSFYWLAGDRSISIIIYGEGVNSEGWYRARNGDDVQTHEGGAPRWMWDVLAEFSAAVEAANPAWRDQRTA